MSTLTEENVILEKTRELCNAILTQPNMRSIRQRIDTFMADEKARGQYETVVSKSQALNEKQQKAQPLNGDEVSEFEKHRESLMNNPVARGFMDAQEELHQLQSSIQEHVAKTIELGRVPTPEDLESGSCGHGCGCHH